MSNCMESTTPVDEKIDVNSSEFYNLMNDEIEYDMARLKKSLEMMKKLRLTAAEMEIETAALFHDELWYNIEELNIEVKNNAADQPREVPQNQIDMSELSDTITDTE